MIFIEHNKILLILSVSIILSIIIGLASYLLSETCPDKEKTSVYECGFTPYDNPGSPISIRFFLIGILFLVFDLEISLLFPWSISLSKCSINGTWIIFIFLLILTWGLIYEWVQGGLEWE